MLMKRSTSEGAKHKHRDNFVGRAVSGLFPEDSLVVDIHAIDVSPSMREEAIVPGQTKLELVQWAENGFLEAKQDLRPLDMVGIVPFNHEVTRVYAPVNVKEGYLGLSQVIGGLSAPPQGGTNIASALEACLDMLERDGFLSSHSPFFCRVLLFSDGHSSSKGRAVAVAQALKDRGALIEALGFGRAPSAVDEALLKQCASTSQDGFVHYRFVSHPDELRLAFDNAATGLATGRLTWED